MPKYQSTDLTLFDRSQNAREPPVSPSLYFRAEFRRLALPVALENDPVGHDEQTDGWVAPAQRTTFLLSACFTACIMVSNACQG